MKDKTIRLETAKVLKEKNFDIWIHGVITEYTTAQKDSEYPEGGGSFGWKKGEIDVDPISFFCNNHSGCDYSNKKYQMYAAPTQSILQKWLREIHNIQVYCYSTTKNGEGKYRDYVAYVNGIPINDARDEEYPTYEDALEAGLVEALKRI